MIETLTTITVVKEDRKYRIEMSPDSSLLELYEVLGEMRNYVVSILNSKLSDNNSIEETVTEEKVE